MNKKIMCLGLVSLLALMTVTNTVSATTTRFVPVQVNNEIAQEEEDNEIKLKIMELLDHLYIIYITLGEEYEDLLTQGYPTQDEAMVVLSLAKDLIKITIKKVENILCNIDEWTLYELKASMMDLLCTIETSIIVLFECYYQFLVEGRSPSDPVMKTIHSTIDAIYNSMIEVQNIIIKVENMIITQQ